MDVTIPDELVDYARTAGAIVGDAAVARARYGPDASPEARMLLIERLESFGLFELSLHTDRDQLLIAGTVLRAIGRAATGLPLPAIVVGRAAGLPGMLHAVGRTTPHMLLDGRDLGMRAWTIDSEGIRAEAVGDERPSGTRTLARFAAPVTLGDGETDDPRWWALHEVLAGFMTLGVLEQALDESRRHLNEREQFGRALKQFQALAHRFADMVVRVHGLAELCLFSAWAYHARPERATVDALLLRLYALDALSDVSRSAHQIHAAIGFCHEHPLADLTASAWFSRTQPLTADEVADLLASRAGEIDMLFSDERVSPAGKS